MYIQYNNKDQLMPTCIYNFKNKINYLFIQVNFYRLLKNVFFCSGCLELRFALYHSVITSVNRNLRTGRFRKKRPAQFNSQFTYIRTADFGFKNIIFPVFFKC